MRGVAGMIQWMLSLGVFCAVGCGGQPTADTDAPQKELLQFPQQMIEQSWPVLMADDEIRRPYQDSAAWVTHVMSREYGRSIEQFGPDGGINVARAHADMADLFRQASLLSANALIQTYGKTPQNTDPIGAAHLLAVSYSLVGDLNEARKQSARLDGVKDPSIPWHEPWKQWLAGDATWPPDLSGMPFKLPEVAPGTWPKIDGAPHYSLPERGEEQRLREMGDPGTLVMLSLWHQKAAKMAAGDQNAVIDTYDARYRWPIEGSVQDTVDLPMEFLFGADYLVPADGPFMAALVGEEGAAAVNEYKDKSLIAFLAANSRLDGKFDATVANDQVMRLRDVLVEASAAKSDNTVQGFHRVFADVARVGALRNLSLVGEIEVDRETGGKLRIGAMELSEDAAGCPVGLISLAAWDAANRYPVRGQEILHNQSRRYDSLNTARYALDVLALRVGRERIDQSPGM